MIHSGDIFFKERRGHITEFPEFSDVSPSFLAEDRGDVVLAGELGLRLADATAALVEKEPDEEADEEGQDTQDDEDDEQDRGHEFFSL
jgi:hypothetical protein